MKVRFPIRRKRGGQPKGAIELYIDSLKTFADDLIEIQSTLDFHIGARGWCYTLEPYGLKKNDFNWMQGQINAARDEGFFKPGFILNDDGHNVIIPKDERQSSEGYFNERFDEMEDAEDYFKRSAQWYSTSFWEGKEYYIQLLVEKVDLKSLFNKVCEQYKIPIANLHGQGSYEQKAIMAHNFMKAEERGLIPILFTFTDFDVAGLQIGEQKEWFVKHQKFTGWNPKNLICDRVGLSYTFIQNNNLTWIKGLGTSGENDDGTQKDLADPKHPQHNNKNVQDYIKRYCGGDYKKARKCEANAIVVVPQLGRQILIDRIERWLGENVYTKYERKIRKGRKEVQKLIEEKIEEMKNEMY